MGRLLAALLTESEKRPAATVATVVAPLAVSENRPRATFATLGPPAPESVAESQVSQGVEVLFRAEPPAPAPLPETAPIYSRMLAVASAAGVDPDAATYIVGVRAVILHEYAGQPDDVLADCLRGWARERPAMCATCGPVWLPQHWPRRVACCPWCASKRAGRPIPRPPFGP